MFRKLISFALPTVALGLAGCGVDAMEQEPVQGTEQLATTEQGLYSVVLNDTNLNFFPPPKVAGDTEFGGNGPEMDINVQLELRNGDTELWVGMYIRAQETDGGDTRAEGWKWYHIFSTTGSAIEKVCLTAADCDAQTARLTQPFSFGFTDTGHGINGYGFPQLIPATRLVWMLSCVGDTDGKEAGSKTGCSAILHDLTVRYY
ncbi:hypothetical protein [Archangium violaceum]|uniref:Lipoprotein n=1 Tax=Archangium violaceum Cb vi76 TaxID=1406225 RepID=A0A084SL38_9BACT|nr:hypothetical protein [Archangium violaceum]KFA89173.1 hypothetical protein Q664_36495 [Archangium violaceum Cb vi76]